MNNIYVPFDNINDFSCYTFVDSNILRAYYNEPINSDNQVVDIYINSHYLQINRTVPFDGNVSCIPVENLTNKIEYRNDLCDICIIATLLCLFCFGIPLYIFNRFFKRAFYN